MPWLLVVGGLYFASWFFEIAVGGLFAVSAHDAHAAAQPHVPQPGAAGHRLLRRARERRAIVAPHQPGHAGPRAVRDTAALQAVVRLLGAIVAMYMTHPLRAVLATVLHRSTTSSCAAPATCRACGCVQNATLAKSNQWRSRRSAMRAVPTNTGEVGEARVFARSINRFLRVVLVTVITQTVVIFTQLGLSKLRDVIVLGVGMWQVITGHGSGRLTIGSFTAFSTCMSRGSRRWPTSGSTCNWCLSRLAASTCQWTAGRASSRVSASGPPCRGALELRDVTFYYPGATDMMVLEKMSFVAQPGQVVALVGESGAGKARWAGSSCATTRAASTSTASTSAARAALAAPADRPRRAGTDAL